MLFLPASLKQLSAPLVGLFALALTSLATGCAAEDTSDGTESSESSVVAAEAQCPAKDVDVRITCETPNGSLGFREHFGTYRVSGSKVVAQGAGKSLECSYAVDPKVGFSSRYAVAGKDVSVDSVEGLKAQVQGDTSLSESDRAAIVAALKSPSLTLSHAMVSNKAVRDAEIRAMHLGFETYDDTARAVAADGVLPPRVSGTSCTAQVILPR